LSFVENDESCIVITKLLEELQWYFIFHSAVHFLYVKHNKLYSA